MGKWVHRLSDIDSEARSGICAECGPVRLKRKSGGRGWQCGEAEKKWKRSGGAQYRKHKGPVCERCDFVPVHKCQLDVDHIDGDHHNNDSANLQTLCANCHRLKTWRQHMDS